MTMNWEQHFRGMKHNPKRPLVLRTKGITFGVELPPEDIVFGADDTGPIESGIGDAIMIKDNMDAIQRFFANAQPATAEAAKIKDSFTKWYDELWITSKYLSSSFDLARNQQKAYSLANAVTPDEKKVVSDVLTTGLSAEQLRGQPDRRDSEGFLPGPVTPPKPPKPSFIPTPWLIAGAAVVGISIILASYGAASSAAGAAMLRH